MMPPAKSDEPARLACITTTGLVNAVAPRRPVPGVAHPQPAAG